MMDLSNVSRLELHHLIVICRVHRGEMSRRRIELEEKLRLGWDGPTREAVLACENEIVLLDGIIAKLWRLYNGPAKQ